MKNKSKKKSVKINNKKESFNLKKEYEKSWDYIKKSKKYIWIITGIFLLMTLIGFLVPAPEFITQEIMQIIEKILERTQGMSSLELMIYIIGNNVQTSFLGMIFGFVLGIFPILTAIINGYVLGFVGIMTVNAESFLTLLKLLPHGIFELPAVMVSLGLGLKLGTFIFKKKPKKALRDYLENSIRVFILIIIPLLLIGGIIEGFFIFLLN